MKKIYLILLAVLSLAFTSCLMEEKEIFDKTPAERMDAYLEEYRSILASNEEGWLLQYYAEEHQSYGGYVYILKFTESDVTAWFQLADDVTKSITTLYKMTPDDGPVLAFDTYNEYLHYFATPSVSDYEALHGDYEFRLVGKNDDASEVYIKGRRSGNLLKLVKFSGDPVAYINACNTVQSGMASPAYKMTVNGVEGSCSLSTNVFTFSYSVTTGEGETATTETFEGSSAMCYTPEGAVFYNPVTIDGVEYTNLVYNATDLTLATEDGKVVIFQVIPPLNQQLVTGNWFIKYSTLGPEGQFYFDYLKQGVDSIGEELQYAFLGSMLYPGNFGFQFVSSGYGGSLNFNYALEGEDVITLQFAMDGAGNGVWYHNNAGFHYALRPFGYDKARTFKLTADDIKSPTQITMAEVNNEANNTITLFAAQIANPFNN